jgi:hypothetical protein
MIEGRTLFSRWPQALVAVLVAQYSLADVIPPPISAGSQYQIVFVTSGQRSAMASDLATYNGFVTMSANQSATLPTSTWKAIAAVRFSGSAQANAPVYPGVPIYNTAGQFVADGSVFYSGTHQSPILYDQNGDAKLTAVWTGITPDGMESAFSPLGGAMASGVYGLSQSQGPGWSSQGTYANMVHEMSFYGLSDVLTAVPEPSIGIWVLATSAAIVGIRRR